MEEEEDEGERTGKSTATHLECSNAETHASFFTPKATIFRLRNYCNYPDRAVYAVSAKESTLLHWEQTRRKLG